MHAEGGRWRLEPSHQLARATRTSCAAPLRRGYRWQCTAQAGVQWSRSGLAAPRQERLRALARVDDPTAAARAEACLDGGSGARGLEVGTLEKVESVGTGLGGKTQPTCKLPTSARRVLG